MDRDFKTYAELMQAMSELPPGEEMPKIVFLREPPTPLEEAQQRLRQAHEETRRLRMLASYMYAFLTWEQWVACCESADLQEEAESAGERLDKFVYRTSS